ncbi:MAG: alpha/beta fold hydrolase [Planctomycetes bacterium]|nr:alpha/beta fold hydrolase [Planctomycetota bacterium]
MVTAQTAQPITGIWQREYPFESHWLDVGEVRMHYVDEGSAGLRPAPAVDILSTAVADRGSAPEAGSAPTLLFLHGNPTWSFYWRHLVQQFRGTHRCVAPDHIGCGLSDKPQHYPYTLAQHIANVRSLVYALDLRDIVLCLHDWGGAIGMGLAAQIPDRIRGFVIFNTAAFPSRRMPLSIGLCRIPGVGDLLIRGLNGFVRGALARCARKALSAEAKAGYLAPYASWEDRIANLRFVQDIPMDESHESWPTLQAVERGLAQFKQHPMLLCWGRHDFVFNDQFMQQWQRRFPGAETQYFENAGHFVVEDARPEIITAMRKFLDGKPQDYTDEHHSSVSLHV